MFSEGEPVTVWRAVSLGSKQAGRHGAMVGAGSVHLIKKLEAEREGWKEVGEGRER